MAFREIIHKYFLLSPIICILTWIAMGPVVYVSHFFVTDFITHLILLISSGLGMFGWIALDPLYNRLEKRFPTEGKKEDPKNKKTTVLVFLLAFLVSIGFYAMTIGIINPELGQFWHLTGIIIICLSILLGLIATGVGVFKR